MSRTSEPRRPEGRDDHDGRLAWTLLPGSREDDADVARGLAARPRTLPCRFFYDERGSLLFERICELPEYYPTRTERALLAARAPEIAARTGARELIELGSGSAAKTQLLIEALGAGVRGGAGPALRYLAIDVSESSLRAGAAALLARHRDLAMAALVGTYEAGLAALAAESGTGSSGARLLLFLGSTIGNLDPGETARFLARARAALRPGDWFLVGTDLDKDPAVIEAAYNDAAGVTAEFNLNLLRHLNRRFRGDFALDRFAHLAFYDRAARQIEMHLRSLAAQTATLAALGCSVRLEEGETIRTEISRKFDLAEFGAELARHGLAPEAAWTDPRGWYGITLARAA
jgi:dimethylhistidine N-methyltransferase